MTTVEKMPWRAQLKPATAQVYAAQMIVIAVAHPLLSEDQLLEPAMNAFDAKTMRGVREEFHKRIRQFESLVSSERDDAPVRMLARCDISVQPADGNGRILQAQFTHRQLWGHVMLRVDGARPLLMCATAWMHGVDPEPSDGSTWSPIGPFDPFKIDWSNPTYPH